MKFVNSPSYLQQQDPSYPKPILQLLGASAPDSITLRGNADLLMNPKRELIALFCSAKAPASVLLAMQDMAHRWRENGSTTISGFHSPAEQEALAVLLRDPSSVVLCPARGIGNMRLKAEWKAPLQEGRMLLASPFADDVKRPTVKTAQYRNRFVAALADQLFLAHAQPGSKTEELAKEVILWRKSLFTFERPANQNLLDLGAIGLADPNQPLR